MIKETSKAVSIAQSACVQERRSHRRKGFSLLELLVAMAVLALVILLTANIVNYARSVWVSTMGMTSSFREGRAAFETMSRRVSQATLNSYVDYLDSGGQSRNIVGDSFVPNRFARESELHFVTGQARDLLSGVATIPEGAGLPGHALFFQAPLGFTEATPTGDAQLPNLLNAVGYFVQYSDDQEWMPKFLRSTLSAKKRYRLMQVVQGSEKLRIYTTPLNAGNRFSWFRDSLDNNPVLARPVAENIIALVAWPRTADEQVNDTLSSDTVQPLTENFLYDTKEYLASSSQRATTSRNQLPPQVQITVIALEEASAQRLEDLPASEKSLLAPGALFNTSSPAANLQEDLGRLVTFLNSKNLRHRVFTTSVVIRQAKFSNN